MADDLVEISEDEKRAILMASAKTGIQDMQTKKQEAKTRVNTPARILSQNENERRANARPFSDRTNIDPAKRATATKANATRAMGGRKAFPAGTTTLGARPKQPGDIE